MMAISQPQESIWAQEGHLTSTVAIGITNTTTIDPIPALALQDIPLIRGMTLTTAL